jgi:hypothetical protein
MPTIKLKLIPTNIPSNLPSDQPSIKQTILKIPNQPFLATTVLHYIYLYDFNHCWKWQVFFESKHHYLYRIYLNLRPLKPPYLALGFEKSDWFSSFFESWKIKL